MTSHTWSPPSDFLYGGARLAFWQESLPTDGGAQAVEIPWLVLHGGPGGALGPAHVAPLRQLGLPWFGFDQRNSGRSEDMPLEDVDLQRCIDDALAVADRCGVDSFNILGGSWGATLAVALAAYAPDRVHRVVLRAPFIPELCRIDDFFEAMEASAPGPFDVAFGIGARTLDICDAMLKATPDKALMLANCWNQLENAVLGFPVALDQQGQLPLQSSDRLSSLVRKYSLQASFFPHECFLPRPEFDACLTVIRESGIHVDIVQGLADRVCPPDGAKAIADHLQWCRLTEIDQGGHLPDSHNMISTLVKVISCQPEWN